MKTGRLSAKKVICGLTLMAAAYAGLWFLTEAKGVPQVRDIAIQAIEQPVLQTNTAEPGESFVEGPMYRCSAGAYAPFIVRADYRWDRGTQSGAGVALYLWFFGRTYRMLEVSGAEA